MPAAAPCSAATSRATHSFPARHQIVSYAFSDACREQPMVVVPLTFPGRWPVGCHGWLAQL